MTRLFRGIVTGLVLFVAGGAAAAAVPADKPEGFGAAAKGGEGGRVILVTTLADSGPGSLREALAAKGPRIVRFAVEGDVVLQSRLRVTEGRVTIDGASAPGAGITLRNHGIQFVNCSDLVVRHLRIRVTTGGASGDCILLWGKDVKVERALVDHCSLMGSTDETVNTWGTVGDATFQWCIIARGKPPHSKGWLSGKGSDRVTIHHCLFADNDDRNPKLEGGLYELVNNVICNWSNNNAAKVRLGARVNVVGNCFVPGPKSAPEKGSVFLEDPPEGAKLFLAGNISTLSPAGAKDQWVNVTLNDKAGSHRPAPDEFRADKPHEGSGLVAEDALAAAAEVLKRAGASHRDADDESVVKDATERLNRLTAK